jgi:hypothetical protein
MIEPIKDVFNIVFFIIISTVTILTYIQAKKTLFSPIKTEIFKFQLKMFEEVLGFFQDKTETDFIGIFDLRNIVIINAYRMTDDYVGSFFADEIPIDEGVKEKRDKSFVGETITIESANKYFDKVGINNPRIEKKPAKEKTTNPAIIFAHWQKYTYDFVGFTKRYDTAIKKLSAMSASPLLPKSLRDQINQFKKSAEDNLGLTREVITMCAKLMTEHYPTAEKMQKFTAEWIWNEFNDRRVHFEPIAHEILVSINTYLRIENIMK